MLRNELIGIWKQKGGGSVLRLQADGKAVCEGHPKSGGVIREEAVWKYVDEEHWSLFFKSDEEEGGVEVREYAVVSFTPTRMELSVADYEFPVMYERVS
ncbi:MAG: hypothetical protein JWR19_3047 [Pedosphaera sp.]|nr:hypothetical protein [Pedosphaera sp.]